MDSTSFLAPNYTGGAFVMFGPAHIITLLVILGAIVFFFLWKDPSERAKTAIRFGFSIAIILNEIALHVYRIWADQWSIQTMLPFHVCAVMVWLTPVLLIKKNHTVFEFYFFLGLAGATQALLTPDVGIYGFPHFRYFSAFISHGLIVLSAVYMAVVEKFRPTWRSIVKVAVWANVYMVIIFFVNQAIGANYMFVAHVPDDPSLIDFLGPWPWYILALEGIGLILFLLLYAPYALRDWRVERAVRLQGDKVSR